jgi:hypothetical protein
MHVQSKSLQYLIALKYLTMIDDAYQCQYSSMKLFSCLSLCIKCVYFYNIDYSSADIKRLCSLVNGPDTNTPQIPPPPPSYTPYLYVLRFQF